MGMRDCAMHSCEKVLNQAVDQMAILLHHVAIRDQRVALVNEQ